MTAVREGSSSEQASQHPCSPFSLPVLRDRRTGPPSQRPQRSSGCCEAAAWASCSASARASQRPQRSSGCCETNGRLPSWPTQTSQRPQRSSGCCEVPAGRPSGTAWSQRPQRSSGCCETVAGHWSPVFPVCHNGPSGPAGVVSSTMEYQCPFCDCHNGPSGPAGVVRSRRTRQSVRWRSSQRPQRSSGCCERMTKSGNNGPSGPAGVVSVPRNR